MALKSKGEKYDDVGGCGEKGQCFKDDCFEGSESSGTCHRRVKQLVQLAMKELDYQPNVVGKSPCSTMDIDSSSYHSRGDGDCKPYYAELIAGIALGLTEKNYTMQIVTEKHQVTDQCDGYIVTGARTSDYSWLKSLNKPVVLFGEI